MIFEKRMNLFIFLSVLFLVSFIAFSSAQEVNPDAEELAESSSIYLLNDCRVINLPGYYELDGDIYSNNEVCFQINSSDVTINGNGHILEGIGNLLFVKSDSEEVLKNVSIFNLVFNEGKVAILLDNIENSYLYENDFSDSSENSSILILNSRNNMICKNTFSYFHDGVYLVNSDNNVICNNAFSNGIKNSISILNSDNNSITDSKFYNSSIFGVYSENSNNNLFAKLFFNNNKNSLFFKNSAENKLSDVFVSKSENYGLIVVSGKKGFFENVQIKESGKSDFSLAGTNLVFKNTNFSKGSISSSNITIENSYGIVNVTGDFILNGMFSNLFDLENNDLFVSSSLFNFFTGSSTGSGTGSGFLVVKPNNLVEIIFKGYTGNTLNLRALRNGILCDTCGEVVSLGNNNYKMIISEGGSYSLIGDSSSNIESSNGGGGSAAGGSLSSSCVTNWNCTSWSDCNNGTQTRLCSKLNVNCNIVNGSRPVLERICEIQNGNSSDLNLTLQEDNKSFFGSITGAVLGMFGSNNALPIVILAILIIALIVVVFSHKEEDTEELKTGEVSEDLKQEADKKEGKKSSKKTKKTESEK